MNSNDETFLKRWSRRKIEATESPGGSEPAAAEAPPTVKDDAEALRDGAAASEKRVLTEADFADVDFDALDMQSDYKRFLEPGVPDSIKYKALRKLWSSDPIFTAIEPFQEYAGDFTDQAVAVPGGTLQTAYRIGRGFMTDGEVAAGEKPGNPETAGGGERPETAAMALAILPLRAADQHEADALLRQLEAYLSHIYPGARQRGPDPAAQIFLARRGSAAVGCGALVVGTDGEAEISHVFVAPDARRQAVGQQIVQSIEAAAKAAGASVVRVALGRRQPEALGFLRACGYAERGPFGPHEAGPLSLFLEKWIG
ncbi:MAG: GNAT family N-acetyltransferase [Hyphomicrobiaceae bacterium]|nr:MAG: GNAT family N-acetyltransferase [Hyphomicrobiaceae bacterium]